MTDEEFKKITKALIKGHRPEMSDEQIDLHHDSSMYWGPENFAQSAEWISRTLLILGAPEKFHNSDVFINFFGVIDDSELAQFLREKTTTTFKLLKVKEADIPAFIASNKDPKTREFFERVWEAKNLIELIRKDFTDEEKFLLRFVRHRHSHVTLSNFAVRIENNGEDVKYKTANWERLVNLSKTMSVVALRTSLVNKLIVHQKNLSRLRNLIAPAQGGRLLPE